MDEGERPANRSMVWVKVGDDLTPRPVKTGMTDGAYKIVEEGLQAGELVVLSAQYVAKEKAKKTGENPFMPGPPGRRSSQNSNKSGNQGSNR